MHRRWTCSPNEELEKWVGGCTFFFLLARFAQDFWILFRTLRGLRGRETALLGLATPTVPRLHPLLCFCVQTCASCTQQRCCKIATNHRRQSTSTSSL